MITQPSDSIILITEQGRGNVLDELKFRLKVAHYYYEDHMTQAEIAQKLSISRLKVNRMLKRMLEDGTVRIEINDYLSKDLELERRLEQLYALRGVSVLPTDGERNLRERLGAFAAGEIFSFLSPNTNVALGWGETLWQMVRHMRVQKNMNIHAFQVAGGFKPQHLDDEEFRKSVNRSESVTIDFAQKLGGVPHLFRCNTFVDNFETKQTLMSEQFILDNLRDIESCDAVILSASGLNPARTPFREKIMSLGDYDLLKKRGAVGYMAFNFVDGNGDWVECPIEDRKIAPTLEQIRKIPLIILVSGGSENREVLRALAGAHMVDVLITDKETALFLAERAGRAAPPPLSDAVAPPAIVHRRRTKAT